MDTVNITGAASERYNVNARDNATVKVALTDNERYVCRTTDTVNVALTAIVCSLVFIFVSAGVKVADTARDR